MTIAIGDKFPPSTFLIMTKDGPAELKSENFMPGKKIVLFAVPGAFTPTCHLNHLPGYLENLETFKSKGVDEIYVVSVNDVWVMDAWSKNSGGKGKISYLSDGSATVSTAIGMDVDLGPVGMGKRSKRYSMIINDGVVTSINIEETPGQAVASGAATLLEQL